MEESALGMDTFKTLSEKYELPLPIVDYDGSNVVVTFPRTIDVVREVMTNIGIESLSEEELRGFEWIRTQGEVATKDYAEHFSYTQRTASRHLGNLLIKKLVKTNGENIKSPKLRYSVSS